MELLKKLSQSFGPSGDEDAVARIIINEIKDYVDDVKRDRLGNVIALKKGSGRYSIMLTAHMDQIGLVATSIEKNGTVRFMKIGRVDPYSILYHRVIFKNRTVGIIVPDSGCSMEDLKIGDLYIDIGCHSREETIKNVNIGDFAVFKPDFHVNENIVYSGALDNRTGCSVLIKTIKNIRAAEPDIYFVFTSQEESYLSGAAAASYAINPNFAIVIDSIEDDNISLGKGPVIMIKDRGIVYNRKIRDYLIETAQRFHIKHQVAVSGNFKGEGLEISKSGSGIPVGAVSIPVKYNHTPSEIMDINDQKCTVELITKVIQDYVI